MEMLDEGPSDYFREALNLTACFFRSLEFNFSIYFKIGVSLLNLAKVLPFQ